MISSEISSGWYSTLGTGCACSPADVPHKFQVDSVSSFETDGDVSSIAGDLGVSDDSEGVSSDESQFYLLAKTTTDEGGGEEELSSVASESGDGEARGGARTVAQSVKNLDNQEPKLSIRVATRSQDPLTPINFSSEETLIIFDWDDTILPSSWLSSRNLNLDSSNSLTESERALLDSLSIKVCRTLEVAVQLGRVAIVTNAEAGWVQLSATKFMPTVLHRLDTLGITVVSARSVFESSRHPTPISWKIQAFYQLIQEAFSSAVFECDQDDDLVSVCSDSELFWQRTPRNKGNCVIRRCASMPQLNRGDPCSGRCSSPRSPERSQQSMWDSWNSKDSYMQSQEVVCNILQFGDSESERLALFEVTQDIGNARSKSFKFADHPCPVVLQQEHDLIVCSLTSMVQYDGRLDLRITIPQVV